VTTFDDVMTPRLVAISAAVAQLTTVCALVNAAAAAVLLRRGDVTAGSSPRHGQSQQPCVIISDRTWCPPSVDRPSAGVSDRRQRRRSRRQSNADQRASSTVRTQPVGLLL